MYDEITADDRAAFDRDGFVIKRGLFYRDEIALVDVVIASDPAIVSNAVAVSDSSGAATELALWNHPSDDIFGAMARSRRMALGATRLLRGEVYHFHTKLTMKRPNVGGAWDWHQDYGYWYQNGCLWPHMLSVGVAIDAATLENGCLEVLTGSHHLGRIEHGRVGGQTGADPERVAAIMRVCPRQALTMEPGDTIFFHCNTLHSSGRNMSNGPRTLMLTAYNLASNSPVIASHTPAYDPLEILADSAVRAAGTRLAPRDYLRADDDRTADLRPATA